MKQKLTSVLLCVILTSTGLLGCGGEREVVISWPPAQPSDKSPQVVFIGIDAADWDEIDPLIAEGRLPNIAKLKSRGAYGNQISVSGASPAIWTSIATGLGVEEHSIYAFTVDNPDYDPNDPDSPQFLPVNSGMRKKKALWNLLTEAGRTVGVVGWFVTWPAEVVNGYIISSYASVDVNKGGSQLTGKGSFYADESVDGLVYPPALMHGTHKAVLSRLANDGVREGNRTSDRIFENYPYRVEKGRLVDETRWVFVADEIFFQVGKEMLKKYPTDFFAVYFAGIDVIGHRFGVYEEHAGVDPPPDYVKPEDKDVLNMYYDRIDEMVGELIALAPEESIIVLASDHGTAYKDPSHDYLGGIYLYAGPGIKPGHYTAQSDSLDFLPTILALMNEAVPAELPKRPMDFLFDSDWLTNNRIKVSQIALERETYDVPSQSQLEENVLGRLGDIGYLDSKGKSKELKGPDRTKIRN